MLQHIYRGERDEENNVSVTVDGQPLRHVLYHSPGGFEWGYGGSGPADLALSILAHYFGENDVNSTSLFKMKIGQEPKCWHYHQNFKWDAIAPLPRTTGSSWQITTGDIGGWVERQPRKEEEE